MFLAKTPLQNFLRERGDITENRQSLINNIIEKTHTGKAHICRS